MNKINPIPWKTFYALYGLGILCALLEVCLITISHAFDNPGDEIDLISGLLLLLVYIPLLLSPLVVYLFLYVTIATLSIPLNLLLPKTKLSQRWQQLITIFLPPLLMGAAVILPITLHLYYQTDPPMSDSDIGTAAHIANWGVIPFYLLGSIIIYLIVNKTSRKAEFRKTVPDTTAKNPTSYTPPGKVASSERSKEEGNPWLPPR